MIGSSESDTRNINTDALLNSYSDGTDVRIVSLLPSITEILASIGASHQIVGITHECDHPPEAIADAQIVTTSEITPYTMTQDEIHQAVCGSLVNGHSLYGMNAKVLQSIRPHFVFTQSLCDICAVSYPVVLDTCARIMGGAKGDHGKDDTDIHPEVISMEPKNLRDVLKTIHVAGKALGREEQATQVVSNLDKGFETIRKIIENCGKTEKVKKRVAFMEWHTPIFTGGHWVPDMINIAGGSYQMGESGDKSKAITDEEFISLDPDVILIGPCGFSLERSLKDTLTMYKEKPWWKNLRAVKLGEVYALDGNSFYARPGPRLLQGCGIMAACIHGAEITEALDRENLAPTSGYCRVTVDMCEK